MERLLNQYISARARLKLGRSPRSHRAIGNSLAKIIGALYSGCRFSEGFSVCFACARVVFIQFTFTYNRIN